jgi:hypothetical protein
MSTRTLKIKTNTVINTNTSGNISLPNGVNRLVFISQPNAGVMTADRSIIMPTAPTDNDICIISILDEIFEGSHSFKYTIKQGATDLLYIDRRTSVEFIYSTTNSKWIQIK